MSETLKTLARACHENRLGRRDFLTSGKAGPQSDLVSQFWGAPLTFTPA